jgi:hypothetical protein
VKPADDHILRSIGNSLRDGHIRCPRGAGRFLPGQLKQRSAQQRQNQGENHDTEKCDSLFMRYSGSTCYHDGT